MSQTFILIAVVVAGLMLAGLVVWDALRRQSARSRVEPADDLPHRDAPADSILYTRSDDRAERPTSSEPIQTPQMAAELREARAQLDAAIAELRRMQDLWEAESRIDSLTGLCNARSLSERLTYEFHRSKRYGTYFSVMRVDIDNLGKYNSEFGDDRRNQFIVSVSECLNAATRNVDLVGVYAAGQFVVLLAETDHEGAMVAAERVCDHVAELPLGSWKATVSIGVASMEPELDNPTQLRDQSYDALCAAVNAGGNRIVSYTSLEKRRD